VLPDRQDQPSVPGEKGRKGPFLASEEALGQSVVSPTETLSGRLSGGKPGSLVLKQLLKPDKPDKSPPRVREEKEGNELV
jgi:hypothetical protein